jgi:hypothetical protein
MLRRAMIAAALAVLAFGIDAAPAAAQAQGLDRAAIAGTRSSSAPGQVKERPGKQNRALPPGIAKRFPDGATLPPGISRTRERPAPELEPDPDPDTGEGDCIMGVLFVNGVPVGTC